MNVVFDTDEAAMVKASELIIGCVIADEIYKSNSRKDICAMRLVSKSWRNHVAAYLLRTRQPLFKISFDQRIEAKFARTLKCSARNIEPSSVSPYSISIKPEFLRHKNYVSFRNFLCENASGLVGLEIEIPQNGGSMTFVFPEAKFPHLNKLTVIFRDTRLEISEGDEEYSYCSHTNQIAIPFIQWILNSSPKLRKFKIQTDVMTGEKSIIPHGIRYLKLPCTINYLNATGLRDSSLLQSLLDFDLPNLSKLYICILDKRYEERLVSRILEKFKKSLKILYFIGPMFSSSRQPPTLFRFPVMEKLQEFHKWSRFAEIEDRHPPLQNMLPQLNHLFIRHQTKESIDKWTTFSSYPNLATLHVQFDDSGKLISPLTCKFPILQNLQLLLHQGHNFALIQNVFLELRHLKKLSITFSSNSSPNNSPDKLDSLITGIPEEVLMAFRTNPTFSQRIQLKQDDTQPSISLLTELQELRLCWQPTSIDIDHQFISDISFRCGFMMMKKLRILCLYGHFKASSSMIETWQKDGREFLID